jgi:hypothetical protein
MAVSKAAKIMTGLSNAVVSSSAAALRRKGEDACALGLVLPGLEKMHTT